MRFNPMAGNPLRTRDDLRAALADLFAPLVPHFSPGRARVRLGGGAAHFDQAAAELEGFARPLWGLAPLALGKGDFDHWDLFREGLANGTDPDHPEFWGEQTDRNQRLVEMAALGFALALIPEIVWQPQSERAKRNIVRYLARANELAYGENNWKFFRILVDLGLERVGAPFDRGPMQAYLDELEHLYLGDGWYRDGPVRRVDHYVPFALHFYSLIYAELAPHDSARAERYRERAALFASDFQHWFAEDGAVLPFGRSLTYRFATGSFWGALAFADLEALPWGVIKSLHLRHLRWWSRHPIADRDGVLSIGYGYPNLMMSESYNSPGSPYWAFKAFLPLALPEDHPFWLAEEAPSPDVDGPVPLPHPGMVVERTTGHCYALSSGQENLQMRHGPEKYAKFAYSSRYAFSVESDQRSFAGGAFDSMLALSDDGRHYRVREANEAALVVGDMLYALWRPWPDVTVETWLLPQGPWHVRLHRIVSERALTLTEGGFALGRADHDPEPVVAEPGKAAVFGPDDVSGIVDLGSDVERQGLAAKAAPNTSLMFPRSWVPQLTGRIEAGLTRLACAVLAIADPEAGAKLWRTPPGMPDLDRIERAFAESGRRVTAIEVAAQ
ncbi:DUF2264 domain-containing protein [Marinivivus vitaminiproducens]|uniref:DUF2264 domain-containing protein n=1 Tax=Marinivivus vitaminiproducens TaxID=3035935 RepID=UPI0027A1269F|nr:DUF2264 domain-containing protein [Geminicoccaceae bacterium SCSIO 64248]